jgi:hypothetical protein
VTDDQLADLAALWLSFADREAGPYSPLYASIARGVANDPSMLDLVRQAPPHAHYPIGFLAAAHDLILAGVEHPLADVYAGTSAADPVPLFRDLCLGEKERILRVLEHRHVQTNECGRSALIALALAMVADRFGPPDALVDAGASAGLNLCYDRYHLDYGPLGALGDSTSSVTVACEVRPPRVLPALPDIPLRVGIDRQPLDVTDPDDRRWLLACVWPDTGRLDRTRAALALAAGDPPDVRRGDMANDVASIVRSLDGDGLVCVLTSWAFAYLPLPAREQFIAQLHEAATDQPVVWICLEGPGVIPDLDVPPAQTSFDIEPSVMAVAGFGDASTTPRATALVHPHGSIIEWTS